MGPVMFGYGLCNDLRNFIGMLLIVFFTPVVGMSGFLLSKYLICDLADACHIIDDAPETHLKLWTPALGRRRA